MFYALIKPLETTYGIPGEASRLQLPSDWREVLGGKQGTAYLMLIVSYESYTCAYGPSYRISDTQWKSPDYKIKHVHSPRPESQ